MTTTLPSFLSALKSAPTAPLVFQVDGQDIRPEYHVTEIKLAHIQALDCGHGKAEWHETLVQLIDGPNQTPDGGTHMSAEKFTKIASAGISSIDAPIDGELYIEFAPANDAAKKLTVQSVESQDGRWLVTLKPFTAGCKPALRQLNSDQNSTSDCCGTNTQQSTTKSSCCTPLQQSGSCC